MRSEPKNRVVLVTPPSSFPRAYVRLPTYPYVVPVVSMTPLIPLGPAYIAASLEEAGFDVKIADLTFTDKTKFDVSVLKKIILKQKPDVVGFSALTWTIPLTYELINALKEEDKDLPIVVGGPHVSALPRRTLEECPAIDAVIVGEGEHTFKGFLKILLTKGISEEMTNLKGLMFRHNDRILGDPSPTYIENLDALPFPARHLFSLETYSKVSDQFKSKRTPVASMITSRGCPHHCMFCTRSNSGHRHRARSPENVVRELEELRDYGFNEVQIPDDNFTQSRQRVIEICRLVKDRGLNMSFDLPNGVRVDHMDEELLSTMYDAGFYSMHLGMESGDNKVLKKIQKGTTAKQAKDAIRIAKKIGYKIVLFTIIGLPGSSMESEEKTFKLIREMDVPFTFSVCTPYPGSQLWESLKDQMQRISWDRFDETNYFNPLYLPEGMTKEQLQECINRARALEEEQGSH